MKFNKWTLGLAAIGVVSLASATKAKADAPPAPNYVESATKGISISGYVDTSVNYQATEGNKATPLDGIPFQGATKRDGFNLDVIELNIEKDVDASPWSSGFKVSLLAGPDAVNYNTSVNSDSSADFAIKQAYVETMAPIGNGLDVKIGVFDTIIGYEVFEAGNNPNFTRSWGYELEPTEHTGMLATYKFSDMVSASLGVANTLEAGIDARDNYHYFGNNNIGTLNGNFAHYWWKTVMGSVTITAPSNMGFMSGSSFYLGAVNGFNGAEDQLNVYAGAVLNTPLKELTTGFAFDFVQYQAPGYDHADAYNFGLYATYKATDKLSFNGRAEYGWHDYELQTGGVGALGDESWYGITGTVEYDLWANVMTRAEVRYETDGSFTAAHRGVSAAGYSTCGLGLYLNVIYKF
jgi:hypothetical protein